jgi:hypothetical protein
MTETESWLQRYQMHRQDLTWPWVYWSSVPMFVVGVVGFLWNLPTPPEFYQISPLLNWGSAFLMAATVYYFILSLSIAIGLLPLVLGIAFIHMWLPLSDFSPQRVSIGLLLAGTIGLWLGHRNKKGLHAIVEDLQTIMIGPAWLLSILYRRLGIPY